LCGGSRSLLQRFSEEQAAEVQASALCFLCHAFAHEGETPNAKAMLKRLEANRLEMALFCQQRQGSSPVTAPAWIDASAVSFEKQRHSHPKPGMHLQ
jgi:hypothetical protein